MSACIIFIFDFNIYFKTSYSKMMKNTQAELVFVPTQGVGHLHSAVEAAKLIIQHDHHISILILNLALDPSTDSSTVNDFIDSQTHQNPYPNRLTFLTLHAPSDSTSPSIFHSLTYSQHMPLVKQVIHERLQLPGSARLAGFILDMFCPTMMDVATHFNVPSYLYFTSGANFFNVWLHLQSLVDKGADFTADEFKDPNTEFHVPGFVNPVIKKVIPHEFFLGDDDKGVSTLLLNHARLYRRCKCILINTFTELETLGIQALLDEAEKKNVPKIYPVGPILDLERKTQSGCKAEEQESIIGWLDDQPLSSVVFLCFGSKGSFEADQMKEIANGLEKSGHRFLWSLSNPSSMDDVPKGFLERTASRGNIIGWAPQVLVLGHPAIGGFVTHCGWNSTLESLWFGVPMAAWPIYAEQNMNAFELVKELGLAVEMMPSIGKKNNIVTAEEVENGVKKLMNLDEETKSKVRKMRDKGRQALKEGGSSHKWLNCFIQDVFSNVN